MRLSAFVVVRMSALDLTAAHDSQRGRRIVGTASNLTGSRPWLALTGLLFLLAGCAAVPLTQVSAGTNSTCTIDANGGLACWGNNTFGQLGIGNFVPFPNPRAVTFFTSVTGLSVGNDFACAISAGALFCWGKNDFGQLGNGTTTLANTPTPVTGLGSGVTAVAAGGSHACAVHQRLWKCWGNNFHGQLGRGPFHGIGEGALETTPQQVFGPFGVISLSPTISAGDQHTCGTAVVDGMRKLFCWGFNNLSQAGQPGGIEIVSPTEVKSPTGVQPIAVAASFQHSCGLYERHAGVDRGVFCWGNNFHGQLGLGNDFPGAHFQPTQQAIDNTAAISTGPNACHTCSLARDGKMHCWGCNNFSQIGDGTTTDRVSATIPVEMKSGVVQISVGGKHTCSWTSPGPHAFCWGRNTDGQLGVRDFADRSTPTRVDGF